MTEFENKRAGLLLGSFVGESLALGVHWIYDPVQLLEKFDDFHRYHAPGKDSYHPSKTAGDQGHVGDQALLLCDSLSTLKSWNPRSFMSTWLDSWQTYDDYFDHATKQVLARVKQGTDPLDAASSSDELAGPARIAPLVALLAHEDEAEIIDAVVSQTMLTHSSAEAEEAAVFLGSLCLSLLRGGELDSSIRSLAPSWALKLANVQLEANHDDGLAELGRSCSIKAALPAVIYLLLKHGQSFEDTLYENTVAGGDNCARGLVLGMILGAYHGRSAIPIELLSGLTNRARIEKVLA